MAWSDDVWSSSIRGDLGGVEGAMVEDKVAEDELDRACTDDCWQGAGDLVTTRCQPGLSPEGLFWSVG